MSEYGQHNQIRHPQPFWLKILQHKLQTVPQPLLQTVCSHGFAQHERSLHLIRGDHQELDVGLADRWHNVSNEHFIRRPHGGLPLAELLIADVASNVCDELTGLA